jgi:hypothetical protein
MTSPLPHHDIYPKGSLNSYDNGVETDTTVSDLETATFYRLSESGTPAPRRRSSTSGSKKEKRLNRSGSKKEGKSGERHVVSSAGEKKKRKKGEREEPGLVSEGKGWKFRNG